MVELPYGEEWRKQRAAFQKLLDPAALLSYMDVQKYERNKLLDGLRSMPSDFYQLIRT